jgi:hypothetical protein
MLSKRAVAALALLLCACDEPSSPPIANSLPPSNALPDVTEVSASTATTASTAESEPEPEPPPAPVGGPHCDQPADDDSDRVCIDYGEHSGSVAPRCFAGASLSEGSCPIEGVIGKCKLPATGVTLVYYEGRSVESAMQVCDTIDGIFTKAV